MTRPLRRNLGLAAVIAVVMGDMLGSGIFFTPGELAQSADQRWQVYFIWSLCGLIVLCGALTLGELASLFPRADATYHIMSEAFGPGWGFVKAWMEAWVSAPGSIAGIAIVFDSVLHLANTNVLDFLKRVRAVTLETLDENLRTVHGFVLNLRPKLKSPDILKGCGAVSLRQMPREARTSR